MNSVSRLWLKEWLRVSALCPLLALPLTVGDALILSGALLTILLFTHIATHALRRCIAESQRLIIVALIAGFGAAIIDLLLQTFCYRQAQQLQIYLPLLAIAPLLSIKANASVFNANAAAKLSRNIADALAAGLAFMVMLTVAAAIRSAVSDDAAIMLGFFVSALLLASANRIDTAANTDSGVASAITPRTRARVTGPLR